MPLLVLGLTLGVLALHQLSHGRSLVVGDPAVAGHHATITTESAIAGSGVARSAEPGSTAAPTDVPMAGGHGVDDRGSHPICGRVCEHPSSLMVCLLALVLLAGCRLLSGPAEARWFALARAAGRLDVRAVVDRGRGSSTSSVSLLSLGISRT